MKKELLIKIFGGSIVLAACALFFVAMQLDVIVKTAIEKGGSLVAGVPVTVQDVDIQILRGKFTLRDFKVGNPKGFTEKHLVSVGKISVAIDWKSLMEDTIVIKEVVVLQPEIAYEKRRRTSNLDALLKGMAGGSSSSPKEKSSAPEKKVKIGFFKIKGGEIHLAARMLGQTRKIDLKLPDIELKNLGSDGASFKDVARQIFAAINKSTYRAVTKHAALQKAGEFADQARKATQGALKGIKGLFKR